MATNANPLFQLTCFLKKCDGPGAEAAWMNKATQLLVLHNTTCTMVSYTFWRSIRYTLDTFFNTWFLSTLCRQYKSAQHTRHEEGMQWARSHFSGVWSTGNVLQTPENTNKASVPAIRVACQHRKLGAQGAWKAFEQFQAQGGNGIPGVTGCVKTCSRYRKIQDTHGHIKAQEINKSRNNKHSLHSNSQIAIPRVYIHNFREINNAQ